MQAGPPDLAQVRLDNALALFEEFVRQTARHADAATLRGLERRFAERLQIQPSYWSQIKGRSRQIGERLARQFEHLSHKPRGWMDVPHPRPRPPRPRRAARCGRRSASARRSRRRDGAAGRRRALHRRPRAHLLPPPPAARAHAAAGPAGRGADAAGVATAPAATASRPSSRRATSSVPPAGDLPAPRAEDPHTLWLRTQTGVAPLKRGR